MARAPEWAERTSSHSAWASLLVLLPAVVVLSDNEVWSLYGAPLQPVAISRKSTERRRRPKQAKTVAMGCDRLPKGAHGKEGVDGSSPSGGSAKAPHNGAFRFGSTCRFSNVGQVWSPLWSLQVENALLASRVARPHAALRRG